MNENNYVAVQISDQMGFTAAARQVLQGTFIHRRKMADRRQELRRRLALEQKNL